MMWKVWNTVPLAGAVLHGDMKDGWLTFASMGSCPRRLAPVPAHWERLPAEELEQLCAQAGEVRRATAALGMLAPNENGAVSADGKGRPLGAPSGTSNQPCRRDARRRWAA